MLVGDRGRWAVVHDDERAGAMKVVRDQRPDRTAYGRFVREIATLDSLTPRPGVVGVLEFHLPEQPSKANFAWLVMPVAAPLREALTGASVPAMVSAVAEIAETLAGLHDEGLAHRDIKPDNLYRHDGRAAVGDFGLVDLPDVTTLHDGRVPGSFGFIADEVLADPAGADGRPADVFALAKSLWVLLVDEGDYPPQGHIRADGGAANLSRRFVVDQIDDLDLIVDRATCHVGSRLTMAELAAELRAWAAEAPPRRRFDLDEAVQRARDAMQPTLLERHATATREDGWREAVAAVKERSGELFDSFRSLEPSASE